MHGTLSMRKYSAKSAKLLDSAEKACFLATKADFSNSTLYFLIESVRSIKFRFMTRERHARDIPAPSLGFRVLCWTISMDFGSKYGSDAYPGDCS
jgi:hypothetical protein